MAKQGALIDNLASSEFWTDLFESTQEWLTTEVFVTDTLLEIFLVLLAASLALPLANRARPPLERWASEHSKIPLLKRFWNTGLTIVFPALWLILQWLAVFAFTQWGIRSNTMVVVASLITAWIIIRLATVAVPNPFWSKTISVTAWFIAALNILGLLDNTIAVLDGAAFSLGQVSISALTIIQGLLTLGVLLWITAIVGHLIEGQLKSSTNLTPSIQVLSIKLVHIGLGTFAFLSALAIVGVDLTALAVVGGAVGVGLGFGLQKIFANLVSGFILLLDKSIKPGDVIAVPGYYGRVDSLGARYVSVTTRDGIEHLIPNEEMVINRVENWSHSHSLLRLRKTVGVHYKTDIHQALALCKEAAAETPRILDDPGPNPLLVDFGDSSVNIEIRFWINDPMNGRANVTSDLLIRIWDKFHANGIEIPYPQRDLHLRTTDIGYLEHAQDSQKEDEQ